MQSVLEQLLKYVVPTAITLIGFLLARMRYLSMKVANLEAKAKAVQDAQTLAPLDEQIKEVEDDVEKDRNAFTASVDVHKS